MGNRAAPEHLGLMDALTRPPKADVAINCGTFK